MTRRRSLRELEHQVEELEAESVSDGPENLAQAFQIVAAEELVGEPVDSVVEARRIIRDEKARKRRTREEAGRRYGCSSNADAERDR